VKTGGKLFFDMASQVRVLYGMTADNYGQIGPETNAAVTAAGIVFYVGATDAQSSYTYAVNVSPKSKVSANIYAKNGTILLNQQTQATGGFLAKDVFLGQQVVVNLDPAFTGMASSVGAAASLSLGRAAAPVEKEVPKSFSLEQSYPNPFNPTTQIRYGLPQSSPVRITVHNMLGQEVAVLVDGVQEAGFHEVRWNGRNAVGSPVGSGVFFYRIQSGTFTDIKKMVLLK
jgi:hypothetical protein